MIKDFSGIELIPGNMGNDCIGNGFHVDKKGNLIECCCEDCGYLLCCLDDFSTENCFTCLKKKCPRNKNRNSFEIFLDKILRLFCRKI